MGPLAGIGDSLIVGTLIPILLGIAMGLSEGGSPLGAIFYIVVWNLLAYFGMRLAYYRGYDLGGAAVEALVGPNATALRDAIVMIGTMVIGAVCATWVSISTSLALPGGGTLQGTLDGIYPKLLPLGFTILCWWLMTKKKVSPIVTMLILLVIAFIGAAVGLPPRSPRRPRKPRSTHRTFRFAYLLLPGPPSPPVRPGHTATERKTMALDTSNWTREDLVREAKLQTDAIQRLNVWLRIGYSLLAVGFLVGYWGFYGGGSTGFGVLGVIVLVAGAVMSVVLKVGTTNAKKNVRAILDAAGVDLDARDKKGERAEKNGRG